MKKILYAMLFFVTLAMPLSMLSYNASEVESLETLLGTSTFETDNGYQVTVTNTLVENDEKAGTFTTHAVYGIVTDDNVSIGQISQYYHGKEIYSGSRHYYSFTNADSPTVINGKYNLKVNSWSTTAHNTSAAGQRSYMYVHMQIHSNYGTDYINSNQYAPVNS